MKLLIRIAGLFLFLVLITGCGSNSTLESYLENHPEELQMIIDDAQEVIDQQGLDLTFNLEIYGSNTLIFNYTYGPDTEIFEGFAEMQAESLSEVGYAFEELAAELRETMEVDVVYIIVRYFDNEGNLLAEQTFAGQ